MASMAPDWFWFLLLLVLVCRAAPSSLADLLHLLPFHNGLNRLSFINMCYLL